MENGTQHKLGKIETSLRYIEKNISKMEKAIENVALVIEKQHTLNERVLKLEEENSKNKVKIRKLEDWRLGIMAGVGVIGVIVGFILNKIF
ncbi:hypothetical protein D8B46_02180 [Candidatus Gracilibacteria bacterium]|nr:MAG: hypothetical protein D8B46_02180 [Candidatus Gracilibacteria bacterium]